MTDHIIFVQTPVRFVAVHGLNTDSEGSREQWWWLWDCSSLPEASLYPRTANRYLLKGDPTGNHPLCVNMFSTSSTEEWSDKLTNKGFLWEVSPEKLEVGKDKLRLGKQQAPGYSKCFLCLLSRVFIFSVVCCQDLVTSSKSRFSIAD